MLARLPRTGYGGIQSGPLDTGFRRYDELAASRGVSTLNGMKSNSSAVNPLCPADTVSISWNTGLGLCGDDFHARRVTELAEQLLAIFPREAEGAHICHAETAVLHVHLYDDTAVSP